MNRYSLFVALFAAAAVYGLLVFWTSRRTAGRSENPAAPTISAQSNPASNNQASAAPRLPAAAVGPEKLDPEKEKIARLRAITNRPEFREMGVRRITRDYQPLFDRLRLSEEKQGLLVTILLDQMTSLSRAERDDYEKLKAQLLTENELAELASFRAELMVGTNTAAAIAELKRLSGGAAVDHEPIIAAVVRAALHNGAPLWAEADKREGAGTLTVADLSGLAAIASQRFEAALNQNAANLTEAERQALRAWFQKTVIDANIGGMKKRLAPGGG